MMGKYIHIKKLRNVNMSASNKLRLYSFKLNKVGGNFLTFGKEEGGLRGGDPVATLVD